MTPVAPATSEFVEFVATAEPRLRVALGAAFGFDVGEDATAEALAFEWEHWDRVLAADNPVGYVFAVGPQHRPAESAASAAAPTRARSKCPGSSQVCRVRSAGCRNVNERS